MIVHLLTRQKVLLHSTTASISQAALFLDIWTEENQENLK